MEANQNAVRLVQPYVEKAIADAILDAITAEGGAIKTAINTAIGELFAGSGDDLPDAAANAGQLFIKTGSTNPGLYVSTGTTTPGWKTVTHAS